MEGGETQTNPKLPDFWGYEKYTREYLLLLAKKGEEGLESIRNYPKKLEIGPDWHQTLNEMEKQTSDGAERWALIGFRDDMRTLVMPRVFVKEERQFHPKLKGNRIYYSAIETEIQRAKSELAIEGLVGDIHTHPSSKLQKIASSPLGSVFFKYGGPGFSVNDLYWKVATDKHWPLSVLVENGQNFMVFKTRQTADATVSPETHSQSAFEKYWHEKFGMKEVGEMWVPPDSSSILDMNKAIAQRYNLVLYKGPRNRNLERIYP